MNPVVADFELHEPFKKGDQVRHKDTGQRGHITALDGWRNLAFVLFEGHVRSDCVRWPRLVKVTPLEQLAECAE